MNLKIIIHFMLHVGTIIVVRMILAWFANAGVLSSRLSVIKCRRIVRRKGLLGNRMDTSFTSSCSDFYKNYPVAASSPGLINISDCTLTSSIPQLLAFLLVSQSILDPFSNPSPPKYTESDGDVHSLDLFDSNQCLSPDSILFQHTLHQSGLSLLQFLRLVLSW